MLTWGTNAKFDIGQQAKVVYSLMKRAVCIPSEISARKSLSKWDIDPITKQTRLASQRENEPSASAERLEIVDECQTTNGTVAVVCSVATVFVGVVSKEQTEGIPRAVGKIDVTAYR